MRHLHLNDSFVSALLGSDPDLDHLDVLTFPSTGVPKYWRRLIVALRACRHDRDLELGPCCYGSLTSVNGSAHGHLRALGGETDHTLARTSPSSPGFLWSLRGGRTCYSALARYWMRIPRGTSSELRRAGLPDRDRISRQTNPDQFSFAGMRSIRC